MPKKGNVSENAKKAIMDAEQELQNYPEMPEHYSTMLKHPSMDATGYYSELDFEIAARLKRCETSVQTKGMLEKAMYDHVRGEIETKGAELKNEIIKLSKQHRIITRAARICNDWEAKEELKKMADSLKSSKALKDYNHLITALEYYAGLYDEEKSMPPESIEALERCIGYQTSGLIVRADSTSERLKEVPSKVKIDLGNMDKFAEQMMESHPSFKERSEEEKERRKPGEKLFYTTATPFAVDACKDTLDALAGNLEERMDLLIINGQTLREMIEEKTQKKNPTKEEIETLSCVYVNAALRTGGRVEVFTPFLTSDGMKTYRPDPVVIEGSEPKEKVTMRFWEILLAKLGFFKDKYKQYQEQQKMDACRERVREKLSFSPKTSEEKKEAKEKGLVTRKVCASLNKEEKKEQKNRQKILEKCKDDYVKAVRMREVIHAQKEALLYSFFPDEGKKREKVELKNNLNSTFTIFRDRPMYYVVAQMLRKGRSLKDVMDPTKYREERVTIAKEFREKYANMTKEEIGRLHVDTMQAYAKEMPALAKEMSQVFKTKEDIRENFHKYYPIITCINSPQMDHIKTPDTIAYCGGEKEYEALMDQLREADGYYGLYKRYDTMYLDFHKALDGGDLKVLYAMDSNLREELVLAGLRGKEPHLAPKLSDNDLYLLPGMLHAHPDIKAGEAKVEKMDEKMISELIKNGAKDVLDLKVEIHDQALPVTKGFAGIAPGMEFGMNIVINGKKLLEMENPVMDKNVMEDNEMDAATM